MSLLFLLGYLVFLLVGIWAIEWLLGGVERPMGPIDPRDADDGAPLRADDRIDARFCPCCGLELINGGACMSCIKCKQ